MDRYRATYPRDDASHADGDASFTGVNSKLSPEKLGDGLARDAVNKTFRDGTASTRGGIVTPVSHNPRLYPQPVTADFLVLTFTWTAANGSGLNLHALGRYWDTFVVMEGTNPLGTYNSDTITGNGAIYAAFAVTGIAQTKAGAWELQIDANTLFLSQGPGVLRVDISADWAASLSAGGDGRMTVTIQPYVGGSMSVDDTNHWANSGGVAGTPRTITIGSSTDAGAAVYETCLTVTADVGRSRMFLEDVIIGGHAGQSGYMATDPESAARSWGLGSQGSEDGREWLLLARTDGIWRMRDGVPPQRFDTPEPIAAACDFVQAAGHIYLFRGADLTPWRWNGAQSGAWEAISTADPGNSTKPTPGAETAELLGDRLLIPQDRDTVLFTDLLDPEHYDPALNVNVDSGAHDRLVRIFPFAQSGVLAFKTRAIFLLQNVTGDLSQLSIAPVTYAVGCVARRTVVQVGADIWFLSHAGVERVSQVLDQRVQTDPVPISDPITPFFRDRVNWRAIDDAAAATLAEYYYLAVPIDGSETNNAVLVYNTSTQQWEGHHEYPIGTSISAWAATDWNGEKRLFGIDHPRGLVYLMNDGPMDRIGVTSYPIQDLLLTRGYQVGTADLKDFTRVQLVLETWWPTWSATLQPGNDDLQTLATNKTKSQVKYKRFDATPYDPSNLLDDHGTQGREDYSVAGDVAGGSIPGQLMIGVHGIAFDRTQQSVERLPVRGRGRWASVEIIGSGRVNIAEVQVEARSAGRTTRTQ